MAGRGADTWQTRPRGWNVPCRIRLRDGGRMIVTGFTRGALPLARSVDRAVCSGVQPRPGGGSGG